MQTIILNNEDKIEEIKVSDWDIEHIDEALSAAENALFRYKKMLIFINKADEVNKDYCNESLVFNNMTEECSMPTYEDCAIDVISGLKAHLERQVKRFAKYCEDLEGYND
jgi:hypothetical protein